MKLMIIGHATGLGGAERVAINLANEMAKRGHDVHLVPISPSEAPPPYPLSEDVKWLPAADRGKLARLANRYLQLKHIAKVRPDVILCNMRSAAFCCAFMGKDVASRTIYTERSDPSDSSYNGLIGAIRHVSFKRLGGFAFQSEAARNRFGDDIKRRSRIIPNIVHVNPADILPPGSPKEKRIVSVARLWPVKNQSLLIEAFARLPADKSEYTLEIYGKGPLDDELSRKIESMGLSGRARLMGTRSDIHRHIANASVFAFSSDSEGVPNALLEAMALGLPCVSTDFSPGSLHEFMEDGVNGLIVPRGDAAALADGINRLLDDEPLRCRIGERAREVLERFSAKKIYDEWEQAFYGIANEG